MAHGDRKMGLTGDSDKEKREEAMRKQAAQKDAAQTQKIEAQAMAQKQRENSENHLFDVEGALNQIKESLLGYTEHWYKYRKKNGDIELTSEKKSLDQKNLCNKWGASVYLKESKSFLNHNTISTILPAKTIQNKGKGTLKTVYSQTIVNNHKYDVESTEDFGDIISIIRNPMIDAMNKSLGGRMIENQEKIRVEKESVTRDEGTENNRQDTSSRLGGLFS